MKAIFTKILHKIRPPKLKPVKEPWELRLMRAAFSALRVAPDEKTPDGRAWIATNIIEPVWGKATSVKFVSDRRTHQYCGDTADYLQRQAGKRSKGSMSSPGKVRYNWAPSNGSLLFTRVKGVLQELPRIGDIVLHQRKSPAHWHGHVMTCLGSVGEKILVVEGNHSQSRICSPETIDDCYEAAETGKKIEGIGVRLIDVNEPCAESLDGYYITCFVRPNAKVFA